MRYNRRMKTPPRSTSFRLGDETLALLVTLSRAMHISQADVLRILIHDIAPIVFEEALERQRQAQHLLDKDTT